VRQAIEESLHQSGPYYVDWRATETVRVLHYAEQAAIVLLGKLSEALGDSR
jgi:hypothetical protein